MALESQEQRQARVARDREHEARQVEAIAQEEKTLAALAERSGGRKALAGAPENKALSGPRENKKKAGSGEGDRLSGVTFASPAAEQAARDAGLTAADFRRKPKSSDKGFTAADVRAIAGDE